MNYQIYEDIEVSNDSLEYGFTSLGPKGPIQKVVKFIPFHLPLEIAHSRIHFKINPALDKYSGIDVCPKKTAYANDILSKIPNLSDYLQVADSGTISNNIK